VGRAFGGRALLALYLAGGLVGSLAHVAWKWSQIRGEYLCQRPDLELPRKPRIRPQTRSLHSFESLKRYLALW